LNDLLLLILFNALIGKYFWNDGDRYEGEWKIGINHGQGNKCDWLNDLLILTLFNAWIGKFFQNNGDRYEGEWKDDMKQGQGSKSDWGDFNIVQCFNRQVLLEWWKYIWRKVVVRLDIWYGKKNRLKRTVNWRRSIWKRSSYYKLLKNKTYFHLLFLAIISEEKNALASLFVELK